MKLFAEEHITDVEDLNTVKGNEQVIDLNTTSNISGIDIADIGSVDVADINKVVVTEPIASLPSEDKTLEMLNSNNAYSKKILNDIQNILDKEPDVNTKVYFNGSSKNAKTIYSIDGTNFEPNRAACVGGGFTKKYAKQLNALIFDGSDKVDENKLLEVIMLYNRISEGLYPICIKSSKYIKLLPSIITAMNNFMNENKSIIRSMYTMFNSNMSTKKEEEKAKLNVVVAR